MACWRCKRNHLKLTTPGTWEFKSNYKVAKSSRGLAVGHYIVCRRDLQKLACMPDGVCIRQCTARGGYGKFILCGTEIEFYIKDFSICNAKLIFDFAKNTNVLSAIDLNIARFKT